MPQAFHVERATRLVLQAMVDAARVKGYEAGVALITAFNPLQESGMEKQTLMVLNKAYDQFTDFRAVATSMAAYSRRRLVDSGTVGSEKILSGEVLNSGSVVRHWSDEIPTEGLSVIISFSGDLQVFDTEIALAGFEALEAYLANLSSPMPFWHTS